MGYPTDIDEITLERVEKELSRRVALWRQGRCCYCKRKLGEEPTCKFPDRHNSNPYKEGLTSVFGFDL